MPTKSRSKEGAGAKSTENADKAIQFIAERIRLDGGVDDGQKAKAIATLEGILDGIGGLLGEAKAREPRDVLNIIHDYMLGTYKYRYQEHSGSIVYAINGHVLNCEAISSIFFGIGRRHGFPIAMRAALAHPVNHAFVTWELGNGKRILWEPLARGGESREYASEAEAIARLARIVMPVTTCTVAYKPEDVLASDCMRIAHDAAGIARLSPLLAEELKQRHDAALEMAKKLAPGNPGPYMRSALGAGDRKVSIEKGRAFAGDEYADYIDSLWKGEDAIIAHLTAIGSKLEAMGIESNKAVLAGLFRRRQEIGW